MSTASKYQDAYANEEAIRKWLMHFLNDRTKGNTTTESNERRFRKLIEGLRTVGNKKYAMKRLMELMKAVDAGLVEIYDMVEKETGA